VPVKTGIHNDLILLNSALRYYRSLPE